MTGSGYVYTDHLGVPTFGIGYALVVKGRHGFAVRGSINDRLLSINRSLDPDDIDLEKVAVALNKRKTAQAKSLVLGHFFNCDGITEGQGEALLRNLVEKEYSNGLKKRIGEAIYNSLLNTKELIALEVTICDI